MGDILVAVFGRCESILDTNTPGVPHRQCEKHKGHVGFHTASEGGVVTTWWGTVEGGVVVNPENPRGYSHHEDEGY